MKRKTINSEQVKNNDLLVPSLTSEVGTRIKSVIKHVGSRRVAANYAGVSEDMLYRYTRGGSRPSFEAVIKLAKAANVSVEWLATGKGEMKCRPSLSSDYKAEQALSSAETKLGSLEGVNFPIASNVVAENSEFYEVKHSLIDISHNQHIAASQRAKAAMLLDVAFGDPVAAEARKDALTSLGQQLHDVNGAIQNAIQEVGYDPGALWGSVLQELASNYNLDVGGIARIIQTLQTDKKPQS